MVSDFKFTDESKSTAYVKFMAQESSAEEFYEKMSKQMDSSDGPFDKFEISLVQSSKK